MKRIYFVYPILAALAITLLSACANMAQGPTGGKKDITAPVYKSSLPEIRSTNVSPKRIEIEFGEYLQLTNPTQNLIVSPPQEKFPSTKAIGKKIIIELKDSLKPNTTYTFDFGNSIGDYTENNPVKDYCYTFSTGDHVDTMTISGTVLQANNLAPATETYVGIYSVFEDSAFQKTPFERIAKTNDEGKFTIRGLAAKPYRIFALQDINGNYRFDQQGESIAIQEKETPIPAIQLSQKCDTTYNDSTKKIDTVICKPINIYTPNDIVLRLYKEDVKYQAYKKIERTSRQNFSLIFEKAEKSIPQIKPINFQATDWYAIEANEATDSIKYWIKDSLVWKMDSIQIAVEYQKTDSAEQFVSTTDTVLAMLSSQYIKKEESDKEDKEKDDEKQRKRGKEIKRTNILNIQKPQNSIEIEDKPIIVWEQPLASFDKSKSKLYYIQDSVKTNVSFSIDSKMNSPRTYEINADIKPEINYFFVIDSASAFDYYGNHNDSISYKFKKKGEEQYGNITLNITPVQNNYLVELINKSDVTVKKGNADNGKITFIHVAPGEYFARVIIDDNKNGKWDTGKYSDKRQPESVYYFTKKMKVRANWDIVEDWNLNEKPITEQRSSEIKVKKEDNVNNKKK